MTIALIHSFNSHVLINHDNNSMKVTVDEDISEEFNITNLSVGYNNQPIKIYSIDKKEPIYLNPISSNWCDIVIEGESSNHKKSISIQRKK